MRTVTCYTKSGDSMKPRVRAGNPQSSVRTDESQPYSEVSSKCHDAVVQPVVEDQIADDRFPVETGAA